MNISMHAVRLGFKRCWIEYLQSLRSPQDQAYYVVTASLALGYLYLRRDTEVAGTDLLMPTFALPSIIAALLAFGIVVGPAFTIASEREDGTLLRHRAMPYGVQSYVVNRLVGESLGLFPQLLVLLVPSFLLFDNLMSNGLAGWLGLIGYLVLGLMAILPIGVAIGALVPTMQKVTTWGMLPVMALAGISGILYPIQQLWGWVQVVAQVFPMYWLGLGLRSVFLPAEAAAVEVGDSWRTAETIAVLGVWAVLGIAVLPAVLRRMARRTSGSQVEKAREQALQWVK